MRLPDCGRVLELRRRAEAAITSWEHLAKPFTGELFDSFRELLDTLVRGVKPTTWHNFLMPYHGVPISDVSAALCWRIAGNAAELTSGRCPPLWCDGVPEHWSAVILTASWPGRTFSGASMSWYRFTVLSGSAAGQIGELRWASGYLSTIARSVGYGLRYGDLYFEHPAELVNMWIAGCVAGIAKHGGPRLSAIHVPSAYRTRNRNVVQLRRRVVDCPRRYEHECSDCFVSFGDCAGGTHRLTWRKAHCPQCNDSRVFDDDLSTRICRACFFKERLK